MSKSKSKSSTSDWALLAWGFFFGVAVCILVSVFGRWPLCY